MCMLTHIILSNVCVLSISGVQSKLPGSGGLFLSHWGSVGVVLLIPTEGRLNYPEHSPALALCSFPSAGRGMMWMGAERVI